jgi:hypothetical protein
MESRNWQAKKAAAETYAEKTGAPIVRSAEELDRMLRENPNVKEIVFIDEDPLAWRGCLRARGG